MRDILHKISGHRRNYLSEIARTKAKLESIAGAIDLTEVDKKNLSTHALNGVQKKVDGEVNLMCDRHNAILEEARQKYERAKRQDSSKVLSAAAILMPLLSNMADKEVLNVFKAQAADRVSREVIGQYVNVKAAMSGDPQNHPLAYQFREADRETRDLLPLEEKEALEHLENAEHLKDYVSHAIEESGFDMMELRGEDTGFSRVRVKQIKHVMRGIDEDKPVNFATGQVDYAETKAEVERLKADMDKYRKQRLGIS